MNTKQAKAIVPPEPHSTGPDFRKAWNYLPRWLQIIRGIDLYCRRYPSGHFDETIKHCEQFFPIS